MIRLKWAVYAVSAMICMELAACGFVPPVRIASSAQVSLGEMDYNTAVPFGPAYTGYVRIETQLVMAVVPQSVTILMGLPAYHTSDPGHTSAETVAAAIRGVRLALGSNPRTVPSELLSTLTSPPGPPTGGRTSTIWQTFAGMGSCQWLPARTGAVMMGQSNVHGPKGRS